MEPKNEIQIEPTSEIENNPATITKELPIKWLKFFAYIRIPLGIVSMLLQAFATMYLLVIVVNLMFCTFGGLVIVGLHKRRLWGWILVLTLVVIEAFLIPLQTYLTYPKVSFYCLFVGITLVAWSLPNIIYFNKRRYMFN